MDDEDLISLPQSKACTRCKQIMAIELFREYPKGKDGYYPMCLECEARQKRQSAASRQPASRRRYASGLMARLHLTGKDY